MFACLFTEAEATPQAICHIRLRRPLQPQPLSSGWYTQQHTGTAHGSLTDSTQQQHQQQQFTTNTADAGAGAAAGADGTQAVSSERLITLHLHTFVYGRVAQKGPRSNGHTTTTSAAGAAADAAGGGADGGSAAASSLAADAFSTALGSAEAALMAAVVGTDEALAALPGGPVVAGGMAGKPLSKLCFGVLMWEPLYMPDLMKWPVWIEKQLYIVSKPDAGWWIAVSLLLACPSTGLLCLLLAYPVHTPACPALGVRSC